jgi:hypothetical protein
LRYGTPRTRGDDRRFSTEGAPNDAFGPNGAAVFKVLDRISWWTWEDVPRLLKLMTRHGERFESIWEAQAQRDVVCKAAQAAGGRLPDDFICLGEIVRQIKIMVTPVEAGRRSGQYSRATADWDDLFTLALCTAEAYMVAGRPELPDEVLEVQTRVWRTAFPDAPVPEAVRAAVARLEGQGT